MSDALTLAYLEQAPAAAAKVLQDIGIDEAAAFLDSVPARLSAPVINQMIPAISARCLERMSPARSASVLRSLSYQDSAGLLRLVRAQWREQVLAELPSNVSRRLVRSLKYPLNVVGAWIDPDVPVLSPEHRVEDALNYLRQTRNASHVFLESTTNGQFMGAVSLAELLQSDHAAALGQLRIDAVKPVSNRAGLASVAFHAGWDDYLFLPVVGRRKNVLGGISRATLRRGVRNERAAASVDPGNIVGQLVFALLLTIAGLVRVIFQTDTSAEHPPTAGPRS